MTRLLLLTLISSIALHSAPAAAQMACGEREGIVAKLVNKRGEVRRGAGLSGSLIFEIWASEETGTWTILKTSPNGLACIMAIGDSWQGYIPEPEGDPV